MVIAKKAEAILTQLADKNTKMGDVRALAKDIKKDHELALALWASEQFFCKATSHFNPGQEVIE